MTVMEREALAPADGGLPIRAAVQQPSLAKYRIPVFAELARRAGLRVHVIYADNSAVPNVTPEGFEATATRMRQLLGGRLFWHSAQWRCASLDEADVVVLSWNTRCLSLIPALLRARAAGVGTVLWGHGCSKNERAWRRGIRNWVARRADSVVLYNHTVARELLREGFARERVHVALNSLDQGPIREAREDWLSRPAELESFRREHGLDGPIILFVSRFEAANRADLLLRAGAELIKTFPTLKICLVGKGDDDARLKALAGELGLGNAVRFPGAIYDEHALAPWFLSARVFCYPVNMGLSLLHAFGYGVPVVTSDRLNLHGPEIEALREGENGLFFAHGDVGSLARALERVLGDDALRAKLSAGALRTVETSFSLESMVDGLESAIRHAAACRKAGRGVQRAAV